MFKLQTEYLTEQYIFEKLTAEGSNYDYDYFWTHFQYELCEQTASFDIIINGEIILGSSLSQLALPHNQFIRDFNNAIFNLLKNSEGVFEVHSMPYVGNSVGNVAIIMKLCDLRTVAFYLKINKKPYNSLSDSKELNGQTASLYQVVEEFLDLKAFYCSIFINVITKLAKPEEKDYMLNLALRRDWLPLEQAWADYKKQHNITDENVKKVIAAEEAKEKKMIKQWWQVWK